MKNIKYIGFDADDTLWINEPFFRDTEKDFLKLFPEIDSEILFNKLNSTEINNISIYGYGIKSFVLSMLETASQLSDDINSKKVESILNLGKIMLNKPVELLPGVIEALDYLSKKYKLLLLTKGDLVDQERKLKKSGLMEYFHHIEIMSEKSDESYLNLFTEINISPSKFLMIGNSLKSDIVPVINVGGYGIHIPFHTTWIHEGIRAEDYPKKNYLKIGNLSEISSLI